MRILSTQHSATTLPTALPTIEEENRTTKSPSLTISTIASPDHQPQVTTLLPPVPPLTSSPVMSMLSKAQNSNNTTKQSMFSDLGSSDKTSGTGIFSDSQQPNIIDYKGFFNKSHVESQNMLDYSQYLKDSNLDLENTNLEDLNGKWIRVV